MVGDDLTLVSNSIIDLARLPPSFSNLLPHIYRVNHRLACDKRFEEAPNPYDDKQGWLKNQNNLLEPIWQAGLILSRAMVEIEDSAEQECEQER